MTLYEHYEKIQAAINAAEDDGYVVQATACCCGEGLYITSDTKTEEPDEWFSVRGF